MTKTKVVLDTNVYLSAIIFGGKPRQIINLIQDGEIHCFISPAIFVEIADKLRNKFLWEDYQITATLHKIRSITQLVYPDTFNRVVPSDPDDDIIIACAIQANVSFIITGDNHLLKLKKFQQIQIISSSQFLHHQV